MEDYRCDIGTEKTHERPILFGDEKQCMGAEPVCTNRTTDFTDDIQNSKLRSNDLERESEAVGESEVR